jgi:hypothetical protein
VAWEWLAPAAAVAGAAVGGGTTWLVARGTWRHSERMAVDARKHKRLEEAYVELLQMAERAGHWADRLYPVMETDPPQPLPELPSPDEQVRVRPLVSAYGSAEVKQLFDEFIECIQKMLDAQRVIVVAQGHKAASMEGEHRLKIVSELRPAQQKKRRELRGAN